MHFSDRKFHFKISTKTKTIPITLLDVDTTKATTIQSAFRAAIARKQLASYGAVQFQHFEACLVVGVGKKSGAGTCAFPAFRATGLSTDISCRLVLQLALQRNALELFKKS
jgi:hypothetical protein